MYLKSVDRKILYEGRFSNVRQGVEQAVELNIDLTNINLKGANLTGGRFDNAYMPEACLWGANLTDANFTSAELQGSDFRLSQLLNCCLAEADCSESNFDGAYFSRTILTDTDLSQCQFSCPSLFQNNLADVKTLLGSIYSHLGEEDCPLSYAPLVIKGLPKRMIFMDHHAIIGGDLKQTNMRDRLFRAILDCADAEKIKVNQ
jgi:uncharacterized protein YjbI with pentapeptide repeats